MWAFCRHWVRGECFLKDEGYPEAIMPPAVATQSIRRDILHQGWEQKFVGQLAVLYLAGKAKSLTKVTLLWRSITPLPQPFLAKNSLKVATRANTTFLHPLSGEIPCTFIAHSINDVAAWYH